MDNYSHYLKLYHDELSRRIRELGSNPDILYPYSIFEREWRHYAPYSFGRAVACIKVILRQKDEVPNLQNAVNNNGVGNFLTDIQGNEKEWIRRTKYIARHFIDMGAF